MNLPLLVILLFIIPLTCFAQVLKLDTVIKGKHLKASWNNVIDSDGYHLYYSTKPFIQVNNIPYIDIGNKTQYDYKLSAADHYYIAVSAHVEGHNLTLSNVAEVKTPAKKLILDPPLLTTAVIKQTAHLQWSVNKSATNYKIYYSNQPFKDISGITYINAGNTNSFSKLLSSGEHFYVAVRASKDNIHSPLSNIEQLHIMAKDSKTRSQSKEPSSTGQVKKSTKIAKRKDSKHINTAMDNKQFNPDSVVINQPINGVIFKKRVKNVKTINTVQNQISPPSQPPVPIVETSYNQASSLVANTPYDQAWIDKQALSSYSIQLISSTRKADLDRFILKYQLTGEIAYTERMVNGKKWYSIINGVYSNIKSAQQGFKNLPQSVLSKKPWINSPYC